MGFSFSKRYYSNLFAKGHSMSSEIWGRGSFEQFLWGGWGSTLRLIPFRRAGTKRKYVVGSVTHINKT